MQLRPWTGPRGSRSVWDLPEGAFHHGIVLHIILRDINPSNIFLDGKFEPWVSDFGLARIISACESYGSTILTGTLDVYR